jgi:hypothetical protein
VEISNEPAVSALGVTAERGGWGHLIVAVGDIHTAKSFPDSLRAKQQSGARVSSSTRGGPGCCLERQRAVRPQRPSLASAVTVVWRTTPCDDQQVRLKHVALTIRSS